MAERLKEEEGRRKAGEDQALRMDGVLTALRQEATALRLAAEEHAKWVTVACSVTVPSMSSATIIQKMDHGSLHGWQGVFHASQLYMMYMVPYRARPSRLERWAEKGFELVSPGPVIFT